MKKTQEFGWIIPYILGFILATILNAVNLTWVSISIAFIFPSVVGLIYNKIQK